MDASELSSLEATVAKLRRDPALLHHEDLHFFRAYLTELGAKIPEKKEEKKEEEKGGKTTHKSQEPPEPVSSEPESGPSEEEPEEPDPEMMKKESLPFPPQPDKQEVELTDEQIDAQAAAKDAATHALENGDLEKALEKYSEAFAFGNVSAMMFAKRADVLLKLQRPCACIADCDAALEVNPDSSKAFKCRGKAYRRLGNWEQAHKDISLAQSLDYDEGLEDEDRYVAQRAKIIEEKKVKERMRSEKRQEKEKKRRKEAAQKKYEESKKKNSGGNHGGFPGNMPGGMPGGMPPGMDPNLMASLFNDPDLMAAIQNPRLANAMQDIMSNPANISKYQNDPEIMNLMSKVMTKFSGGGGVPGGMGGSSFPRSQSDEGPTFEPADANEVD